MRKFVVIGAMLLLSACSTETNKEVELLSKPVRFEYDGHKYIHFSVYVYHNGVVHDPDCPCHKEE